MARSHQTSLGNFHVDVRGRLVAAGPAPADRSVGIGVVARDWPTIGHAAGIVIAGDRGSLIALLDAHEINIFIADLTKAKDELVRIAAGQPSGKLQ